MPSPIPCQRHLFDFAEDVTYLNCGYMSPLLHSVREAGDAGLRYKTRPWTMAGKVYVDSPQTARTAFARVIGANPEDIAIVPSVSYGVAVAAANVEVRGRPKPSAARGTIPLQCLCLGPTRGTSRRHGAARAVVQPTATGQQWVLEAIDDDTVLAAIPNCHFSDGSLIDLDAVSKALRAVGGLLDRRRHAIRRSPAHRCRGHPAGLPDVCRL